MCDQNVNGYLTGYGTFKMELGKMESEKGTTTTTTTTVIT